MPRDETTDAALTRLQHKWLHMRSQVSSCTTFNPDTDIDHRHAMCMVDTMYLTSMIGLLVNRISQQLRDDANEMPLETFFKDYRIPPCLLPMSERIIDFATDMSHLLRNAQPLSTSTLEDLKYLTGE